MKTLNCDKTPCSLAHIIRLSDDSVAFIFRVKQRPFKFLPSYMASYSRISTFIRVFAQLVFTSDLLLTADEPKYVNVG
jgi:hypothetical protein